MLGYHPGQDSLYSEQFKPALLRKEEEDYLR